MGTNTHKPHLTAIAARIGAAMAEKGYDDASLAAALGSPDTKGSLVWNWRSGRSMPHIKTRAKLMELLDLTEAELTPGKRRGRQVKTPSKRKTMFKEAWRTQAQALDMDHGPAQRAMALAADVLPGRGTSVLPPGPPVSDVLTFAARSNGDIQIKLNVTLPAPQALPLIQALLAQGVVMAPAAPAQIQAQAPAQAGTKQEDAA